MPFEIASPIPGESRAGRGGERLCKTDGDMKQVTLLDNWNGVALVAVCDWFLNAPKKYI